MRRPRLHITCLGLLVFVLAGIAPARAEELIDQTLGLYARDEVPVVTTGRSPRPISKIAENVIVITAEQISRLNAHTLAEVLQTVPGVQMDQIRTPGSFAFFNIQGALNTSIQVLIDGVPQNDLVQNIAEAGLIPVQYIERVEIVKGAASAAWGPALGGVVNVVTKSPENGRRFGGVASASMGERFTGDLRGEVSGAVGRFGYYLSGGNLHSDGLLPNNGVSFTSAYGKFTYDLPRKGSLTLAVDYRDAYHGLDESVSDDFHDQSWQLASHAALNFTYPITDRLHLELMGRGILRQGETQLGFVSTTDLFSNPRQWESGYGVGGKLSWDFAGHNLVAGVDYDHFKVRNREPVNEIPESFIDRRLDRWGTYLNGAFNLGDVTILPGVRLDHTATAGDYVSYTVGVTNRLTDKTVLRAYGAQGYSLPTIVLSDKLQKIWTLQTGVESSEVPYLWLKGTLFYNRVSDLADLNSELHDQIRQGFELEARTTPFHGFSLAAGYTYIDAWDTTTKEKLQSSGFQSVPPQQAKASFLYDNNPLGLKATLTSNYVWWNAPASDGALYKAVIWDLHLQQKLLPTWDLSPELFFSAHNLFSGSQYGNSLFKNAPRWFEGGVRFRF